MIAVLRHECVALLRTRAAWLYLLVLGSLLALAAVSGARWRVEVHAERTAAMAAQQRSIADATEPPRQPWAVPWVTLARAPVAIELPLGPLAPAAIDRIDRHRTSSTLDIQPPDPSDGETRNLSPFLLSAGRFDLAMLIVMLFPLGLIALAHDLWVAERTRGTLALVQVCAPSPARWLVATILGRWLALVVPVIVGVAAVLAWWGAATSWGAAVLLVAVGAYGLLWLVVCGAIGIRATSTTWSATAAIAAWIGVVVLIPALAGVAANALVQVPTVVQVEVELERDALDGERAGAALLQSYLDEHPELARRGVEDDPKAWAKPYLLVLQAEAERRWRVIEAQEERFAMRRAFASLAASLSPAQTMHSALVSLAGHDDDRLSAYRAASVAQRRQRRDALTERVLWSRPFDPQDPALTTATPIVGAPREAAAAPWLALLLLQLLAAAAALRWALRRTRRSPARSR